MVHVSKRARRPERPNVRLAERRKRRRTILAILALVLLGGALGGVVYASHDPLFSMSNVEVRGAVEVPASVLETYGRTVLQQEEEKILSGATILTYPKQRMEREIKERFLHIASVKVAPSSLLSAHLVIAIEERAPYARWCTDESLASCFLMDAEGLVYAELEREIPLPERAVFLGALASGVPIGERYAPDAFHTIRSFIDALATRDEGVAFVRLLDAPEYDVELESGLVLKASSLRSSEAMLADMVDGLTAESLQGRESELEYIDLRFPGRMYYRFK